VRADAAGLAEWAAKLERGLMPTLAQPAAAPAGGGRDEEEAEACEVDLSQPGPPQGCAGLDWGDVPAAPPEREPEAWPPEPVGSRLVAAMARLQVASVAGRYPPVARALLRSVVELLTRFERRQRAAEAAAAGDAEAAALALEEEAEDEMSDEEKLFSLSNEEDAWDPYAEYEAAQRAEAGDPGAEEPSAPAGPALAASSSSSPLGGEDGPPLLDLEQVAEELVGEFEARWAPAVQALSRASAAFSTIDSLVGGGGGDFDVDADLWRRRGWGDMEGLRKQLEDCRQLRELVRSLGRGAGWGPLRRSPVQAFDEAGRDGLIRSVLEQQETRGLCRSDDLGRMLPAEAALLAKGRTARPAKLLFFARMAERALLSYERDGWSEQPTEVPNPLVREVRPTADRGPILLCIDTSGSMRGQREVVAKSLALECMRAAREQERGCYAFCFSGPREVEEMELGDNPAGLTRLLDFLERTFNGGSNFDEPIKRCLGRLLDAEWANSDILIVSDGELRPPAPEWAKKLAGAKDKLALRVHGLALPAAETIRRKDQEVDTSVLKSLCTNPRRGGKEEVAVHVFREWDALEKDVFAEEELTISAAVQRGKLVEAWRKKEVQRLRQEKRALMREGAGADGKQQDKHDRRVRAHPAARYDKA